MTSRTSHLVYLLHFTLIQRGGKQKWHLFPGLPEISRAVSRELLGACGMAVNRFFLSCCLTWSGGLCGQLTDRENEA